jgi:adenosylhomocysteine nucleosidase
MADSGRMGLVAVHGESPSLRKALQEEGGERYGEAIFYIGSIGSQPVVLAEVLLGPVNAALGSQALIARYGAKRLISFGSAGALDGRLSVGDLVIGQRAIVHDAGMFVGHRFEPSGAMGRNRQGHVGYRRTFEADPGLVAEAMVAAQSLGEPVHCGTVVTGNQTIFSTARKRWLHQTFGALAVEMESAAVAQTATAHGLPWIAVRAISDAASDERVLDFGRLWPYLDEARPAWQQRASRWVYLFTHPAAWRRLRDFQRGLALASDRASRLVEAMLRGYH